MDKESIVKYCRNRKLNILSMFVAIAAFIVSTTLFIIGIIGNETKNIAINGVFVGVLIVLIGILVFNRVGLERKIIQEQTKLIEEIESLREQLAHTHVQRETNLVAAKPKRKYTRKQI